MTLQQLIGARIRPRRKELQLTGEQLAEKTDISVAHLSMIEKGVSFPRCEVLIDLLNGLETTADFIFQDVFNKTAQYKSSQLWEKMKDLPEEKKQKILAVAEILTQVL